MTTRVPGSMNDTHLMAPTRFVEANGVRYPRPRSCD